MSTYSEETWIEVQRIDQRIARVKMLICHQESIVERKLKAGLSIEESALLLEQLWESLSLLETSSEQVGEQRHAPPKKPGEPYQGIIMNRCIPDEIARFTSTNHQ